MKIGITGGIGSGKSVVCEIFKHLGIPVFNADEEAKALLNTELVVDFYFNQFGEKAFTNNILDKNKIASLIFSDKPALEKVNNFIHPLVFNEFENWCTKYAEKPYVIHEAALIFESKSQEHFNATILVHAPFEMRIQRVILRDKVERAIVEQRIINQMDDNEKIKLTNYSINNDGSELLIPQVLNLHNKFITKNI
jgi:dephospho-CoA kinase